MKSLIVILFVACVYSSTADEVPKECDNLNILIYEELGCKPEYEKGEKCPKYYTCGEYKTDEATCNFQGRTYKASEQLDNDLTYQSCSVGCICNGGNRFTCAVLDCPEWLGLRPNSSCYSTYELNGCCSSGMKCEPYDNLATCEYEGQTYKEGQKFFPTDRCYKCVCQSGFKGVLEEPFCSRTKCGIEIKHAPKIAQNCAPVYEAYDKCCTSGYACPSSDEVIISGKQESEQKCKYGDKTLNIGDTFEKKVDTYAKKDADALCKCEIPPLVTCNVK